MELPGGPLFAKKQSRTFEEATDEAMDALKKQITKHKQKMSLLQVALANQKAQL